MFKNYSVVLLLIIILSVAGGVVGGILVRSYFLNSSFNIPLLGDINLSSQYQGGNLVISQPKKVIVEQNERISAVLQDAKKNVVRLYKKKLSSNNTNDNISSVIKTYYSDKDLLGEGVVLTNDGWVITALNVSVPNNFVVVTSNNKIFDIQAVVHDKVTNYFFVKVDASNLSATQFSEKDAIINGQMVMNLNQNNVDIAYVQNIHFDSNAGSTKSSDMYYNRIKISDATWIRGSMVLSIDGSLAGLYEKEGLVTPMYQFNNLLAGFLSDQKIVRPVLGINYLNLYELIGPDKLEGVLVTKNANNIAVVKNSPADQAGILLNDVITEVDGRKISETNTFSDIVQNHHSGDTLDLTILRSGEQKNINIILD